MKPLDVYGKKEAAALLGISHQRLNIIAKREGFPAPVARLASGPVWDGPALRAYAAQRKGT